MRLEGIDPSDEQLTNIEARGVIKSASRLRGYITEVAYAKRTLIAYQEPDEGARVTVEPIVAGGFTPGHVNVVIFP